MPSKKPVKKAVRQTSSPAASAKKRTVKNEAPAASKSVGASKVVSASKSKSKTSKLSSRAKVNKVALPRLEDQRAALLTLRDRVTGQISFLSDDANHKDDVPPEDRTDEFDREFALSLVSTEKDALYEIDEALRRIDQGVYGLCEYCGGAVEKNRLQALPFARNCLDCQSDLEKHDRRGEGSLSSVGNSGSRNFEELESSDTN